MIERQLNRRQVWPLPEVDSPNPTAVEYNRPSRGTPNNVDVARIIGLPLRTVQAKIASPVQIRGNALYFEASVEQATVEIFNLLGRCLSRRIVKPDAGGIYRLNFPKWSPQPTIVVVTISGDSIMRKLVTSVGKP